MQEVKVTIVNAFAQGKKGGNPAGVVLDADELNQQEKQEIARKTSLSETVFISGSQEADFRFEFFTPSRQIAHCGHATIAAFSYLKQLGEIKGDVSSKETVDGVRKIYFEGEMAFMEQQKPVFEQMDEVDNIKALHALGLTQLHLIANRPPEIVNTGNAFLIVPVKNEHILSKIQPNQSLISTLSEKYGLIGFYLYAVPTERISAGEDAIDATTRMFAPFYGINEEAATGMAAGPLACYLDKYNNKVQLTYQITQGRFMNPPSPSQILVRLQKNSFGIQGLYAGGGAYVSNIK